jgi:hypothetical protein
MSRHVNAHADVNGGMRLCLNKSNEVVSATLLFGGIPPAGGLWHSKTGVQSLVGKTMGMGMVAPLMQVRVRE